MASPFWQYFHDKLNWPAIFRPGPVSALAKGLALYMDDVREDILWLRRQWNPATADDERIAAYGASRGILRTRYDTDESYRLRVVNAFAWHKLGGKVQGLVRILAENGFAGAVIVPVNDVRRHDAAFSHNGAATYNDGLCWAQFDVKLVEIPEQGLNADILAWFRWLVNEYKPARSILRAMSWKTNLEDETAFTEGDGVWLAVKPEYEDRRKWGFPLHDGSIRYDNGLFRAHDGRLFHDGANTYTRWEPFGHLHDARIESLDVAVRPVMADAVRYVPLHDGALLYDGQGRHGTLETPAVDTLNTRLSARCREVLDVREDVETRLKVTVLDEVGRYHDGSITHGQRYISLYNGAFFHDGSHSRGPFGGRADFSGVRHDGRSRHDGQARHSLWGWLPKAGERAPVFTYATLSDVCAVAVRLEGTAGMEDAFSLTEDVTVRVLRYTLHDGTAFHNSGPRYGGKELV